MPRTLAIAKMLNEDGIPRKHGYEKWLPSSINYVLNNERYMGDALLQKSYTTETLPFRKMKNDGRLPQYYVENSNPAIVSRETFQAAQNLLCSRKTERCERKSYPLTGKLRCPECGRVFRHQVVNGKAHRIGSCRSSGATECQHRHVREDIVYEIFTDMAIKLKTYRAELLGTLIHQMETMQERTSRNQERIRQIDKEIADLGESFGAYKIGNDEKIIPLITSANIACGYHAGDPVVMDKTLLLCKENETSVGAHPGFPDLIGFGRRQINASPKEVESYVTYQIGALDAFCRKYGLKLNHVKPHGALYNMAVKNTDYAMAIVRAVKNFDSSIKLLAPFGSQMISQAEKQGIDFACEIFADRAYESDGSLVARTKEGAMIIDENEAVERVLSMIINGNVKAINGDIINIKADSVCVHGDGEKALAFVERLRMAFDENGISAEAM